MTNKTQISYFRETFFGVLALTVIFFGTGVSLAVYPLPNEPPQDIIKLCFSLAQIGFGGMVGLFGGKATTASQ